MSSPVPTGLDTIVAWAPHRLRTTDDSFRNLPEIPTIMISTKSEDLNVSELMHLAS